MRPPNTHWKRAFGDEPFTSITCWTEILRPDPLCFRTGLDYPKTWKSYLYTSETGKEPCSGPALIDPALCKAGVRPDHLPSSNPVENRALGARQWRAGARPVMTAGGRAKFSWKGPSVLRRFGRFLESLAAVPRGARHFGAAAAVRGGGRGLLTGGGGWRRRRPRRARAGGATARHRVQPLRVGSRPGMRATAEGRRGERGRPPWGGGVRGETGQGRRPGRGGAPDRSPSPLTSAGSSSSLGLHHFLWGGLPPPQPAPAPDGVAVRPGPARAGGSGGAGRGWADRKSGRGEAGMAAVGRLGKQKDGGGGGGKQSSGVSVGGRLERRGGRGLRAPRQGGRRLRGQHSPAAGRARPLASASPGPRLNF